MFEYIHKEQRAAHKIRHLGKHYKNILCIGCSVAWFKRYYTMNQNVSITSLRMYSWIDNTDLLSYDLIYVYDILFIADIDCFIKQVGDAHILLEDLFIKSSCLRLLEKPVYQKINSNDVYYDVGTLIEDDGTSKVYAEINDCGHILYGPYAFLDRGEYLVDFEFSHFPNLLASDTFEVCKISCEQVPEVILSEYSVTTTDLQYDTKFRLSFSLEQVAKVEFKVLNYGHIPIAVKVQNTCTKVIDYVAPKYMCEDEFSYEIAQNLVERLYYRNDFSMMYAKLIKNLDNNDAEYIKFLIDRLLETHKLKTMSKEMQNEGEQRDYMRLTAEFYNKIIKHDDIYTYENLKFSSPMLEPSGFYYQLGLNSIDTAVYSDKDAIDAGAYVGDTSYILTQYTNKMVHAFEPVKSNYCDLINTIEMNGLKRIIPYNMGLGTTTKTEPIKVNYGASKITFDKNEAESGVEQIAIISIDDFVAQNNLNIGIIKIDTEGYERYVLEGAKEVIKTQKPLIILSIYHSVDDFFELKPMLEKINNKYKFKVMKMLPQSRLIDTVLLCY